MPVHVAPLVAIGVGSAIAGGYYWLNKQGYINKLLGKGTISPPPVLPAKTSTTNVTPVTPTPSPTPTPTPTPSPRPEKSIPVPDVPTIDLDNPEVINKQIENPTLTVTGNDVNVRIGPGTTFTIITKVNKGDKVKVASGETSAPATAGAPQGWSHIVLPDNREGWIASQYVSISADTTAAVTQKVANMTSDISKSLSGLFHGENESDAKNSAAQTAAVNLYHYLTKYGVPSNSNTVVKAFQKAHNKCRSQHNAFGNLSANGLYDPATSAVLTQYTNLPIAGNPKFRSRTASLGEVLTVKEAGNYNNAGSAKLAQFNLKSYLRKYGNRTDDPNYATLVAEFQNAVNTDPLFPGPSYKISPKPAIISPPLHESGVLDRDTYRAMNYKL